ncbi:calcitonin receptor-stimulating peptide 2-like [Bos indicus x Bos taurus]|uniref:calcitonin receptor-stimulating peptide 2-like n=1 Tax=Bos indicus x Bos taurus TaxID=30522 RepID=UPI000F7D2794|nr:calcitonin receptor-stimulating peptide 2-like [Bos indicus x Bos taurus]
MEWDACLFKTFETEQTQSSGNKSSCSRWEVSEAFKCLHHFCQSAIAHRQSYCCCSFLCSQPPGAGYQRGIMGFSKLPLFLVLSMLIIHQAGMLQAAPFRSVWKNGLVPATLTEEESYFLLATMVKYYVQKASELEYETEDFGIIAQERTSNAATGMTHKMAGFLGKSGSKIKRNIMSTNVAPKPLAGTTGIFRTK